MTELERDIRTVKSALRKAGVPAKLLAGIDTRALRTGRKITGDHPTNRHSRWTLSPDSPQYATKEHCQIILLRLLGMLLEFQDAPAVGREVEVILERYLERPLRHGQYRDALTLEPLYYQTVVLEVQQSRPGHSSLHIGHIDPTAIPKHVPHNVEWREYRSNLIQGNLTLAGARTRFVQLIARYFELGEVRIEPE